MTRLQVFPIPALLLPLLLPSAGCQKTEKLLPAPVPRQLTESARYEGEPHVSPDGSAVVFSAFGTADRDLFVVPVKGGEVHPLFEGPGNQERPRWSPDGKMVVFASDAQGSSDIWMVAADGSGAKPLTFEASTDREPDFSPTGDRIVFVSDRGGRRDLWVLTVATGAEAPLTAATPPIPHYEIMDPFWAKDRILFAARPTETVSSPRGEQAAVVRTLYSISENGGAWTPLLEGPSSKRHPAVSRDGRIAFASDTTTFQNIQVLETDGRLTTVTESRTDCFDLAWTPDGRSLVYTRRSAWFLLAVPAGGGGSVDTLLDARGGNFDPSWSPDALEIAYRSDLAGEGDIWRLEVGEMAGATVTTNREDDREPDWSPTLNRICYTAVRNGNMDVWVMDPSGIEFFNVTNHPARDRMPRWTPDGKEILFVSDRDGNDDLWIVPARGGEPRRLTDDPAPDRWPAITQLGGVSWVAFESARSGAPAIWRMPLGGGPAAQVTRPVAPGDWHGRPAASRTSDGLVVFTASRGDNADLYTVNVFEAGEPRLLHGSPGSHEDNGAFSPDGKRIAFESGGNFDIWAVEVPVPPAPDEKASR